MSCSVLTCRERVTYPATVHIKQGINLKVELCLPHGEDLDVLEVVPR